MSVIRLMHLHDECIRRHGGIPGLREEGCMERSLGAAETAAAYSNTDDNDILTAAVRAGFYLCRNHCFSDGNKRIGWATIVDVLAQAGLEIDRPETEAKDIMVRVADGSLSAEELQAWVAGCLIAIPS